jgi:CO/xanthine dehydrogenase FAD-binding subunit
VTDLPAFRYSRPGNLEEALVALRRRGACVYAGGTDLLVALQHRDARFAWIRELVDIKHLQFEAGGIHEGETGLYVGALVTARELATNARVRREAPALHEAAAATSAPLLRARGTIGGNLVTPHPAGDVTTALLALDASVHIIGSRGGPRRVPVAQLMTTPPARGHLIQNVFVPRRPESTFEKVAHRQVFARSMVAVAVARHGRSLRVAVGGVHDRPFVSTLAGSRWTVAALESALVATSAPLRRLDAVRLGLVVSLVRRALARLG